MRRSTSPHGKSKSNKKSPRYRRANSYPISVDQPPLPPDRSKTDHEIQTLTQYRDDLHISIDRAERLWDWYHQMNNRHKEKNDDINTDLDFTVYSEIAFLGEEWTAKDFKTVHEQLNDDYNAQVDGINEDYQYMVEEYESELEEYNEELEERKSNPI